MDKDIKVVLTGGGTGGHIFPLISVYRELKAEYGNQVECVFIGSIDGMERKIMKEEGIKSSFVLAGKFRRYLSPHYILDIFKIPIGILQALVLLLVYMPDVIFSKGGYASFPVVVVAWVYRIPVLIHESDSIPGVANRVLGKLSARIAIAYERARRYFVADKVLLTGNPVRKSIMQGNRDRAYSKLNLSNQRPVILVLGGSQGAENVNKSILQIMPELLRSYQVIHQTGENNLDKVRELAAFEGIKPGRDNYYPIAFLNDEDMADFLAVADLVISRSGASSIAEIAANGKPAILIPLSTAANNHQSMNAYELAESGAAIVLEESNLGRNILLQKIEKIISDSEFRDQLSENVKKFYYPDANQKIIEGMMGLIR